MSKQIVYYDIQIFQKTGNVINPVNPILHYDETMLPRIGEYISIDGLHTGRVFDIVHEFNKIEQYELDYRHIVKIYIE